MADLAIDIGDSTGSLEAKISKGSFHVDSSGGYYNDVLGNWRGEPWIPKREPCIRQPRVEPKTSKRWSIFRVPVHIRVVDDMAYTPKIVSIGPFHHNSPVLKPMEAQKLRFLNRLLERIRHKKSRLDLENAMRNLKERTRNCYSEEFAKMDDNCFAQMMLLDACFIVELLRLNDKVSKEEDLEEPIFGTRCTLPIIGRDLLMLENQIPMFVLQDIYDLTSLDDNPTPLYKLALKFFESLRPCKDKVSEERLNTDSPHLLASFQSSFIPVHCDTNAQSTGPKKKWNEYERLPGKGLVNNARRLTYAGIKLRCEFGDPDHLLDIEFERGCLKIPTLLLDDGMCSLLRNLIAYEQGNRYTVPYFTCLAVLLDSMVDTTSDIDILRNSGIIKQAKGGNDEVVDLLNSLTKELEFNMEDCDIIDEVIEDVNDFCRTRKAKMKICFWGYFSRADSILSFIISCISLIMTIVSLFLFAE